MVFCCILQYFVAKSVFFCNLRCFVAKPVLVRFTRFCVEKNLAKNCAREEKMTNMRYGGVFFYSVWTLFWVPRHCVFLVCIVLPLYVSS